MTSYKYKIQEINTKDIVVDELGQRDVERRKAQFNKIMRNFDPNLVQDLSVAFIDGKYVCFDGQMTRKVLIAQNKGKHLPVRCKVYCGMTNLDAALMFTKQRGFVSTVDMADKIRVKANYGFEEELDFIKRTESNGLNISWTKSKCNRAVVAVSTLFNCYKSFSNKDDYSAFIRVIANAWNGDPDSTKSQILKGLSYFMDVYKGQWDEARLTSHLAPILPNDIIRNASADRTSGARKYAVQILDAYNKGSRGENRLPNLL